MEEIKNINESTTENTESVNETSEENGKVSSTDYKIIIDMIKEVDEQYKSLKESLDTMVNSTYGVKSIILDKILPYVKEEIANLSDTEIRDFLNKYLIDNEDNRYNEMEKDELIEVMTSIKSASLVLLTTKKEADELKESSNDLLKDYFNYMTSDKIKKSREKRLEAMREALELEQDELKKKKIKNMIDVMESTLNFSFIKSRFEKFGSKELEAIRSGFFDYSRGSYNIDRYKSKISKFGYNKDIYKYFFNIEENFLAKKYSPFNNLFLFIYMRMVAYSDPYDKNDKMMVQSLTGALANLIYHKFNSLENEQYFISVISDVIDQFINNEEFDYVTYFKENNTTYEEHPARIEARENYEKRQKDLLIKSLSDLNVSGIDENLSIDELKEIYNREYKKLVDSQIETNKQENELSIDEAEEVLDSEEDTTIDPCLKIKKNSLYGEIKNTNDSEDFASVDSNK